MSDYAELVKRLEGAYSTVFERSLAKTAADAIKALVQERGVLLAENSKLRSALEIVHFKQEPWQ